MLRNYLTIAIRSLLKDKVYSIINITGLAAGITVSVLILIFVSHEFSYDRFHTNGERIFRAEKQFSRDGRHSLYGNPEFGPTMKEIDPHVVNYVRLFDMGRKVVQSDPQHKFFEDRVLFADTAFFSVFSFPLLKGDRKALTASGTIVVTEGTALKYFGTTDVIGKSLIFDKDVSFVVVGLAANTPTNSSIQFDFIASFSTLLVMPSTRDMVLNNSSGFPTYLLLSQADDLPTVEKSILTTDYTNKSITYSLAPLYGNHFNLNFGDTANTRYVYIFLCIAVLVLVLALVNYMNLTTARAASRAKEIGVRKVIGARPRSLTTQFYLESALTTTVSFCLAMALIEIFRPMLLGLLEQPVDSSFLTSPFFISIVAGLLVLCILLAGSYPAIVLPRFKTVEVLKGNFRSGDHRVWIRKSLIAFQFSVTIGLAVCALIMNHQLGFLQSMNTGFDRQQVMVVPVDQVPASARHALKSELRAQAGVLDAAIASVPLYNSSMSGVSLVTSPVTNEKVGTKWIVVDRDFLQVLGIPTTDDLKRSNIEGNHLLNQTAMTAFGMSDTKPGHPLTMGGDHVPAVRGEIVGVIADFNYESLRQPIQPLIISVVSDSSSGLNDNSALYVRLQPDSRLDHNIAAISTIFRKHSSDTPFTYYFLDDAFNQLQKGESRLKDLFNLFTYVALAIATLGLFGLVTYTIEKRKRELSLRKLLGASVDNIILLLTGDLALPLLLSIVFGIPVAVIFMREWLASFYYRTDIPLLLISLPALAVIVISAIIVCIKGVGVFSGNPARNLGNE